jgi:hypothetical protein
VAFCAYKRNQASNFSGFVGDKARKQKFSEVKKSREKPLDKEPEICDNTATVNERAKCSMVVSDQEKN